MGLPPAGLWHDAEFLKLWSGQTVSQFGSQVTQFALPLTAALTLQATAWQMGVLGAAEFAPFLLFGLFAGVWVDRLPRRHILIAADLGRAVLLGLIPLAAWFGVLRIELLYAVSFLFAVGSGGALLGALLASRIAGRIGLGPTVVGAAMLLPVGALLVVVAAGPPLVVAAILVAAWAATSFSSPIYNVNQVSLRQAITPDRLQGRMNATMRFIVWGTIPIGALLGGFLGDAIGLRATLLVSAIGGGLAFPWVLLSPVSRLRDQPTPAQAGASQSDPRARLSSDL